MSVNLLMSNYLAKIFSKNFFSKFIILKKNHPLSIWHIFKAFLTQLYLNKGEKLRKLPQSTK